MLIAHTLHIPAAGSGWSLIMQSGVLIPVTVGRPLQRVLEEELRIPANLLKQIDVLLLDGKPVDEPKKTLIPDGSRLALASGLPGIAGLAMKSGSAVRGLRPGITHQESGLNDMQERPGHIELALFSLTLPLLAPHFLGNGVLVPASRVLPYLRPAITPSCILDGAPLPIEDTIHTLQTVAEDALIRLTANLAD